MRVALIAPPYPLEEAPSPPLGLCYIAAACIASGAEVAIFDYIVSRYTPEKLRKALDSFKPDVVGTTAVTMNFRTAAGIMREAKQHNSSLITMIGGPHTTFDFQNTLNEYPEIDLVIMGEGEQTIAELLPIITNGQAWSKIKGISFRKDGEVVTTEPRQLIENLDELPLPARHLLPISRYQALGYPVSIITSRGCPNQCIFCLGRRMVGYKVRYRSTAKVVDEIEHLLLYGIDRINIADDIFTANKERVRELCGEIKNRSLTFGWSAFSRVNTVDQETLITMREVGCDSISFGIESGNPEMLNRVKKGITLDQARNAIRYCKEAGISPHASFMVGLPGENQQTLKDSRKFGEELDIPHGYHLLAPFPGTTIRENIDQYDLEILTENWDLYDANRAIVRTAALSATEMDNFVTAFDQVGDKDWQEIKERVRQGQGTPYESLRVEGDYRMRLIFKLLTEDLISEIGTFPRDGSSLADELAQRITVATGMEPDFVNKTVNSLIDAGYLDFDTFDGHVSWFWTHNNHVTKQSIIEG